MVTPIDFEQYEAQLLELGIRDEVLSVCERFDVWGIRGVKLGPCQATGDPYQVRLTIDGGRKRCLYRYLGRDDAWWELGLTGIQWFPPGQ